MVHRVEAKLRAWSIALVHTERTRAAERRLEVVAAAFEAHQATRQEVSEAILGLEDAWLNAAAQAVAQVKGRQEAWGFRQEAWGFVGSKPPERDPAIRAFEVDEFGDPLPGGKR